MPDAANAQAGQNSAREKPSAKSIVTFVFTAALVLFAVFYSELMPHISQYFYIYAESYTMYFVGIGVFLVYLNFPASKKIGEKHKGKFIWYDLVLGVIALVASFYVGLNFETLYGTVNVNSLQSVLGWLMVIVILEAARRAVGMPMVIVSLVFLAYLFFGNKISGFLHTTTFTNAKVIKYIYMSTEGVFGMPIQIVSTTVIAFITFGAFLSCSKAGEFYKNLALSLVGALRGGAAKAAIVCSCLFSTMTGEPVSNAGIVGPLTLPLMKKLNYDKTFSAATVAVASCGSMIMPPVMAAVAFLIGQMTGLGYGAVVKAAILPAILYYCALYWQIDFFTAKNGYQSVPREELPRLRIVFRSGWQYLVPIVVLVYFLLVLRWTASGAIYRSLLVLILVALIKKDDRQYFVKRIKQAIFESGISSLPTIAVSAAAGIIMASVTMTGLGLKLSAYLEILSGGNLFVLALLTAVTIYIMGMGMAPIVSYILMAILVAPAMINLGVEVIAAHFFILYMSISTFVTPPFALASYMTASMTESDGFQVSLKAMRLGIGCFLIPFVSIFSPALMGIGNVGEVITSFVTAFIGVIFIAAALEGYMFAKVSIWQRILFALAGLGLFIPGTLTDVVGIVLAVAPLYFQFRERRNCRVSDEMKDTQMSAESIVQTGNNDAAADSTNSQVL